MNTISLPEFITVAAGLLIGWAALQWLFRRQDRIQRYREIRVCHLVETYGKFMQVLNKGILSQDDFERFYSVMVDFWLFGSPEQIRLTEKCIQAINKSSPEAGQLLASLRDELRHELGLPKTEYAGTIVKYTPRDAKVESKTPGSQPTDT